jgi:DNA-binding PadR family transcriptional regulator
MGQAFGLGPFEELVLIAVMRLGEGAYGVPVRRAVEEMGGRGVSVGALYTTLDRLEEKGYLSSRQGEPTPERGGRAKRYFRMEGAGLRALEEADRVRQRREAAARRWGHLRPSEGGMA